MTNDELLIIDCQECGKPFFFFNAENHNSQITAAINWGATKCTHCGHQFSQSEVVTLSH